LYQLTVDILKSILGSDRILNNEKFESEIET